MSSPQNNEKPKHLAIGGAKIPTIDAPKRKALYGLAAAVGAVMTVFGFASTEQVNSVMDLGGEIGALLPTIMAVVAMFKTTDSVAEVQHGRVVASKNAAETTGDPVEIKRTVDFDAVKNDPDSV